jgi:hypothetical protein
MQVGGIQHVIDTILIERLAAGSNGLLEIDLTVDTCRSVLHHIAQNQSD